MNNPRIVSREKWLEARKALMAKEKELTRASRRIGRRAPCAAMGASREAVRLRRAARQGDAGRAV